MWPFLGANVSILSSLRGQSVEKEWLVASEWCSTVVAMAGSANFDSFVVSSQRGSFVGILIDREIQVD